MCSNENWIGVLGGLAAATAMLATTYTDKHSAHAHAQAHAPAAAISAPAVSGDRSGVQTQAPSAS